MLDKRLRSPGRHHVLEDMVLPEDHLQMVLPEDHLLTGGGHPAIFNVKSGAARRPPVEILGLLEPHPSP